MRYLITGGAGFIGSHMAERLLADGHEVAVLDNLSTGRIENLGAVRDQIRYFQGSVLDALLVDELVASTDITVHLGAAVGVKLIVDKPLHSFLTNIRGTETVLEAAHRYRKKVLVASTSEIYGKNNNVPFKEDDDRVLGSTSILRWGYSTSKAADEILAFAYHRERGVPTVVVRLFNTVGPRQTGMYGMVLPRFARQAVRGEPLTVYDDGKQTRCFCHVVDVVDAMLRLLDERQAEGEVFNVGGTEEVSILEVAERIVDLSQSKSEIRFVPYEEAYEKGYEDMRRRVPDISKIRELVGWEPTKSLDDILKDIVGEAAATASEGRGDVVSQTSRS
ncbi:MAG: GDP-mannose 4,6-dehydratase [Actinomycetota bacterium]